MANENVYDEKWDDVEEEVKEASKGTGIYVDLVDDGDEAFIAFVQKAQTRKVMSEKYGLKSKTRVNVAKFNGALQFIGIEILSLAPTKFADVIEVRREYGGHKIYKIRRRGPKEYPQTKYNLFPQRDLTDDEKAAIAQHPLHELWEDAASNGDDPVSPPPSVAHKPEALESKAFGEVLVAEMKRLGWTPDDYKVANKTFFGEGFRAFPELDPIERQDILDAIRKLVEGTKASEVGYRIMDTVDLGEDEKFF